MQNMDEDQTSSSLYVMQGIDFERTCGNFLYW